MKQQILTESVVASCYMFSLCVFSFLNTLPDRIMEEWGLLQTQWVAPCQGWTCKKIHQTLKILFIIIIVFVSLLFISSSLLFALRGPGGRGPWPGPNANSVSHKLMKLKGFPLFISLKLLGTPLFSCLAASSPEAAILNLKVQTPLGVSRWFSGVAK